MPRDASRSDALVLPLIEERLTASTEKVVTERIRARSTVEHRDVEVEDFVTVEHVEEQTPKRRRRA